jgi:hypothetical protein
MELRNQAARCGLILAALCAAAAAQTLDYPVRQKRTLRDCPGVLRFSAQGVRFMPAKPSRHCRALEWPYGDIQRLDLAGTFIAIAGYRDRMLLAGKDETARFTLEGGPLLDPLHEHLRARMDQRLVVRRAQDGVEPLWSVRAKLLGRWRGNQGTLSAGPRALVFRAQEAGAARTWRDEDIENVSSSGPFHLSVTVREGAAPRTYEFLLKEALPESRFEQLWRRLNQPRGLQLLTGKGENKQ